MVMVMAMVTITWVSVIVKLHYLHLIRQIMHRRLYS